MKYPKRPEEGFESPGTGDGVKNLSYHRDTRNRNLGFLEEQPMLFSPEPSL